MLTYIHIRGLYYAASVIKGGFFRGIEYLFQVTHKKVVELLIP